MLTYTKIGSGKDEVLRFPKLFKRTATGAVQMWWQEIVGGNAHRVHSGQWGGEIVKSTPTVCVGKNVGRSNETTAEEQCVLEVEANYRAKIKAGYCEDLESAKSSDRFQPMLAKHYTDYLDKAGAMIHARRAYSQPKLDGIRGIATEYSMMSRKNTPIVAVPHILEALEIAFNAIPELKLDGELYNHDMRADFNSIVSLVRKTSLTDEDLERSRAGMQYWIYDSPMNDSESFESRVSRIADVVAMCDSPYIRLVPTVRVEDHQHLDTLYAAWLEEGYEGQMIRLEAPYEQKRSSNLLKRKETQDREYKVLEILEGIGNRSGMAGVVVIDLGNGETCKPNAVGSREYLTNLLQNKHKFIGKQATVEFFGYTPDGSLRFPRVKIIHEQRRI